MTEKKYTKADLFKFVGLIIFFALMGIVVYFLWPYLADLFTEGGVERVITQVQEAGIWGVAILLGMQFLQIVVAFIPGEVTQFAAGMLYGPFWGTLLVLVGCVISSAFIYMLVHKLGAPFVHSIVSTKYLDKFKQFEESGKLNVIVFILFLIPGLPKDVFTYLVPLTDMKMKNFLILSNTARIPGIFISTYAAEGLVDGRIGQSIVIFAIAAVVVILGLIFREKLMAAVESITHSLSRKLHQGQGADEGEVKQQKQEGKKGFETRSAPTKAGCIQSDEPSTPK